DEPRVARHDHPARPRACPGGAPFEHEAAGAARVRAATHTAVRKPAVAAASARLPATVRAAPGCSRQRRRDLESLRPHARDSTLGALGRAHGSAWGVLVRRGRALGRVVAGRDPQLHRRRQRLTLTGRAGIGAIGPFDDAADALEEQLACFPGIHLVLRHTRRKARGILRGTRAPAFDERVAGHLPAALPAHVGAAPRDASVASLREGGERTRVGGAVSPAGAAVLAGRAGHPRTGGAPHGERAASGEAAAAPGRRTAAFARFGVSAPRGGRILDLLVLVEADQVGTGGEQDPREDPPERASATRRVSTGAHQKLPEIPADAALA